KNNRPQALALEQEEAAALSKRTTASVSAGEVEGRHQDEYTASSDFCPAGAEIMDPDECAAAFDFLVSESTMKQAPKAGTTSSGEEVVRRQSRGAVLSYLQLLAKRKRTSLRNKSHYTRTSVHLYDGSDTGFEVFDNTKCTTSKGKFL
ncbi:unnamed protein product, partial [Amoebophrya sp. A120]